MINHNYYFSSRIQAMATFQELGKQYTRRIREAFIADGFSRFKGISPYDLKLSNILRELRVNP